MNLYFVAGCLSDMPAVKTFAIYATVAVLFDFLLQTTAFVALLAVDESRYKVCKITQKTLQQRLQILE